MKNLKQLTSKQIQDTKNVKGGLEPRSVELDHLGNFNFMVDG